MPFKIPAAQQEMLDEAKKRGVSKNRFIVGAISLADYFDNHAGLPETIKTTYHRELFKVLREELKHDGGTPTQLAKLDELVEWYTLQKELLKKKGANK